MRYAEYWADCEAKKISKSGELTRCHRQDCHPTLEYIIGLGPVDWYACCKICRSGTTGLCGWEGEAVSEWNKKQSRKSDEQ
jgi:hypothetical protein